MKYSRKVLKHILKYTDVNTWIDDLAGLYTAFTAEHTTAGAHDYSAIGWKGAAAFCAIQGGAYSGSYEPLTILPNSYNIDGITASLGLYTFSLDIALTTTTYQVHYALISPTNRLRAVNNGKATGSFTVQTHNSGGASTRLGADDILFVAAMEG